MKEFTVLICSMIIHLLSSKGTALGLVLSLIHILNQMEWQADEDTILDWADTEGYPVDGTIDADGQYSLSLIHISAP